MIQGAPCRIISSAWPVCRPRSYTRLFQPLVLCPDCLSSPKLPVRRRIRQLYRAWSSPSHRWKFRYPPGKRTSGAAVLHGRSRGWALMVGISQRHFAGPDFCFRALLFRVGFCRHEARGTLSALATYNGYDGLWQNSVVQMGIKKLFPWPT